MARERTPPRARIVCVTTVHPHRHIVSVGIGGEPVAPFTTLVVAEVRAALAAGTAFYTLSPSTGKEAQVRADTCAVEGCPAATIRSVSDAVADNNLDNLPTCS
jgi:hypothetical protein